MPPLINAAAAVTWRSIVWAASKYAAMASAAVRPGRVWGVMVPVVGDIAAGTVFPVLPPPQPATATIASSSSADHLISTAAPQPPSAVSRGCITAHTRMVARGLSLPARDGALAPGGAAAEGTDTEAKNRA